MYIYLYIYLISCHRLDYDPSFVREKEGKGDKLDKLPELAIYTLTVPPSLAIPSLENGNEDVKTDLDSPSLSSTLDSTVSHKYVVCCMQI
jgi:hypothetical protein